MRVFAIVALLALSHSAAYALDYVRPINQDCTSHVSGDVNLFPQQFYISGNTVQNPSNTEVVNTEGFSVSYYNTYKVVKNNIANETYVLYQCGVPAPNATDFPAGTKFFQIPLTSVSAPETVPYAFLELLGLQNRVNDVSSYVTSACGQKILSCSGGTAPDATMLDNTTMLQSTVGPYIDGLLASSALNYSKSFSFSSTQDPGLLNRLEWIKFLGTFFNLDKYSSQIYDAIAQQYNNTKAAVAKNANGPAPVIAWVNHFQFGNDSHYELSFANYKTQLTQDAGGAMLDFNATANIPGVRPSEFSNTTLEFAWDHKKGSPSFATQQDAQAALMKVLQNVSAIVDETYAVDPTTYNMTSFLQEFNLTQADAASWLNNSLIFREDGLLSKNNGLDWFEGALTRPDKVLQDMNRIVNITRGMNATIPSTWLRRITDSPVVVGPSQCTRLTSCNATASPICPYVSACPSGKIVLLTSDLSNSTSQNVLDNQATQQGQCTYAACPAANTAQMAAPAIVILTILIVFVEALINFC